MLWEMKCPKCSKEMKCGELLMVKGALDWGIFGLGFSSLFFREVGGAIKQRVMEYGEVREAQICARCGITVFGSG